MKEAKRALSTITDQGLVAKPSWTTLPGGDSDRRVVRCNAHEDCCVKVRIRIVMGVVNLSRNNAEHSTVENNFDRKNAKLTREEKSEMATARGYGGTLQHYGPYYEPYNLTLLHYSTMDHIIR